MKNVLIRMGDNILLRKCSIIEIINNELKNRCKSNVTGIGPLNTLLTRFM